MVPSAPIASQADHVPSGVAVLPERVSKAEFVPVGFWVVESSLSQSEALLPESKTRDSKVPLEAYGLILSQSTLTLGPPALKSLASGRIWVPMATLSVRTRLPSTKNLTSLAVHSMR